MLLSPRYRTPQIAILEFKVLSTQPRLDQTLNSHCTIADIFSY